MNIDNAVIGMLKGGTLVGVDCQLALVEMDEEKREITKAVVVRDLAKEVAAGREPQWTVRLTINDKTTTLAVASGFDEAHLRLMSKIARTVYTAFECLLAAGKDLYDEELARGPKLELN